MKKVYRKYKAGDKFGYITLIEKTDKRKNSGGVVWKCRCVCGKEFERATDSINESIRQGCVISCGCKKPSDIGRRELNNPVRIERSKKAMGQIHGTTVCNINRKNMNKNNKSGVRGVCFKQREQKWQADIELGGKHIGRRLFKNKDDAIAWRKELEETYFAPIIKEWQESEVEQE